MGIALKWSSRQKATQAISAHLQEMGSVSNGEVTSAALLLVKNNTKGFKDSNFNVMKSVMELASVVCQLHGDAELPFPEWAGNDLVSVAVEKIADKKLFSSSQSMLLDLCSVMLPSSFVEISNTKLEAVRAPVAHENFLKWLLQFCTEFGCGPLTRDLKTTVTLLLKVSPVGRISFSFGLVC